MIDIHEMTVLLVDDMISMAKSIHSMMKVIGFGRKFIFCNSGKEALAKLQEEPVDLLMLDYNMPGMTGAELLSIIRADRDLRDMPVVMVTAEAYSDYVAEVGESDIDAYILKPVTIKILENRLSMVIDKYNNPPLMVYHLKRARSFEEMGDIDTAIQEAELAREANPDVTRPIRELGYYYFLKDDLANAEKWLLKAAKMNYLDVFAFHYLGELYLQQNKIEKAAHYFEKAMKVSPRHLSRGINFGKTLIRMKIVSKAIDVFNKVFEFSHDNAGLREEIADFCIKEDVLEYAVQLLEVIVKEQPNRADLFFKLGENLEQLGDLKKAVSYLSKSAGIDKENVNTRIHLAKDYLALSKPMMAEKPLRELLEMNPNNELAKELLRQCI